jgi:hypothetical protein
VPLLKQVGDFFSGLEGNLRDGVLSMDALRQRRKTN